MIKILIDCFGGDHSPQAPVEGALAALAKNPDLYILLCGDQEILRKELAGKAYDANRVEIVHAPEVIGCDEKPTDVVRLKRNSSMMKGIILLRDRDDIAAMVSTGSTGALVTGALVRLSVRGSLCVRLVFVLRLRVLPVLILSRAGVPGFRIPLRRRSFIVLCLAHDGCDFLQMLFRILPASHHEAHEEAPGHNDDEDSGDEGRSGSAQRDHEAGRSVSGLGRADEILEGKSHGKSPRRLACRCGYMWSGALTPMRSRPLAMTRLTARRRASLDPVVTGSPAFRI